MPLSYSSICISLQLHLPQIACWSFEVAERSDAGGVCFEHSPLQSASTRHYLMPYITHRELSLSLLYCWDYTVEEAAAIMKSKMPPEMDRKADYYYLCFLSAAALTPRALRLLRADALPIYIDISIHIAAHFIAPPNASPWGAYCCSLRFYAIRRDDIHIDMLHFIFRKVDARLLYILCAYYKIHTS